MIRAVIALCGLAIFATACASNPVRGDFNPFTCELREPKPGGPTHDADCLRAAQAGAERAREADRKRPPPR